MSYIKELYLKGKNDMDNIYQQERYKDIIYHLIPRVEREAKLKLASYLDKYGLEIILNTYLLQQCRRVDQSTIVMNNLPIIINFERDNNGNRTYKFFQGTFYQGLNVTNTNIGKTIEVISADINIIIKICRIFMPEFNITKNEDMRIMLNIERYLDNETDNSFRTIRLCHEVYGFAYSMLDTLRELNKIKGEGESNGEEKKLKVVKNRPY